MEKNAYEPRKYKRKLVDKAIDAIPLRPGKVLERVFNPEITEIMNKLDKADDTIRKVIEDVDPDKLLKNVKSNVYKREYLIAISDLSEFYDAMKLINDTLVDFDKEYQEKVHTKFLFEGLKGNDKARKRLEDLEKKFARTITDLEMKKEAGNFLTDFWGRHISERGRALKAWENRFPGKVKALQTGMSTIISQSEDLTNLLSECLDEMSTFRRKRNIEEYEQQSIKIRLAYNKYNQDFKAFYNGYAKPLITQLKAFEAKQSVGPTGSDVTGLPETVTFQKDPVITPSIPKAETPKVDVPKTQEINQSTATKEELEKAIDSNLRYKEIHARRFHDAKLVGDTALMSQQKAHMDKKDELIAKYREQLSKLQDKVAYNNFINELEVFAHEDQSFLISRIAKYATAIQHKSPETALKLINIIDNLSE